MATHIPEETAVVCCAVCHEPTGGVKRSSVCRQVMALPARFLQRAACGRGMSGRHRV